MSTKCTLKYGEDKDTGVGFHLYRDGFDLDEKFVYLELEGVAFEAATSFKLSGDGLGRVDIRIPDSVASQLGLIDRRPEVKE